MKTNVLKSFWFGFFFVLFTGCAHAAVFVPHAEDKPMQSYLAMNLEYPRYAKLLQLVERGDNIHLINRGEAHITVISPVEYDNVLKRHLSIQEIQNIAMASNLQSIPFQEVCIGRGQKILQGKQERTYFVVVNSPILLRLREKVAEAYVAKGGRPQDFRPDIFFPHITLGFTARDLHFEDGVIKNASSCVVRPMPF